MHGMSDAATMKLHPLVFANVVGGESPCFSMILLHARGNAWNV